MRIKNIKKLCYELYKIDWLSRMASARMQMDNLLNYYEDVKGFDYEGTYEDYLDEYGYGSELYVCFDEFIDNEYQDKDFIRGLLADNEKLYAEYLSDLGDDSHHAEDNSWLNEYGPDLEDAWRESDDTPEADDDKIEVAVRRETICPELAGDGTFSTILVERSVLLKYFEERILPSFRGDDTSVSNKGLFDEWLDEYTADDTLDLYGFISNETNEGKDTSIKHYEKFDKPVYGVSQFDHGHEHRWIFEEDVLKGALGTDDILGMSNSDIHYPIGGSNSMPVYFEKLSDMASVEKFLISDAGGPDSADPTLVDIGEYYLTVDTDYYSCTQSYLDRLGLSEKDLVQSDDAYGHGDESERMISRLKESGYEDFDYDDPFYGEDSQMRFSELCELYNSIVCKNQ